MNQFKIIIKNDRKEKEQSFEATANFEYTWDNSWLGYGGLLDMTAFGKTEEEARERLINELFTFQSEFVKALSNISPHCRTRE
jgi:hypothetical protein